MYGDKLRDDSLDDFLGIEVPSGTDFVPLDSYGTNRAGYKAPIDYITVDPSVQFAIDFGKGLIDPENPGAEGIAAAGAHTVAGIGSGLNWLGDKTDTQWLQNVGETLYKARDTELFLEEKERTGADKVFYETAKASVEILKNAAMYGGLKSLKNVPGGDFAIDFAVGALDNTAYLDSRRYDQGSGAGGIPQGALFAANMAINALPNLVPDTVGRGVVNKIFGGGHINTFSDTTDVFENYIGQPLTEKASTFQEDRLMSSAKRAETQAAQVESDLKRKKDALHARKLVDDYQVMWTPPD